jgi:hypothetical protein
MTEKDSSLHPLCKEATYIIPAVGQNNAKENIKGIASWQQGARKIMPTYALNPCLPSGFLLK